MYNRERTQSFDETTSPSTIGRTVDREYCDIDPTTVTYDAGKTCLAGQYTTHVTSDFETPDFHKRIAQGEIINNAFRSERTTVLYPGPFTFDVTYKSPCETGVNPYYGFRVHGTNVYFFAADPGKSSYQAPLIYEEEHIAAVQALQQSVSQIAVTQANARIDLSELQALVTAAESGKTLMSLQSVFRRTVRVMHALRKLRFRELRHELSPRELADRYMELRYAFRPLYFEAKGIVAAWDKQTANIRKSFRGYAEGSYEHVSDSEDVYLVGGVDGKVRRSLKVMVSARASVLCDCEISSTGIYGLDQLAESVWELIPFSFIVDWFINVGDTIAAYSPNAGVNQLASSVTVKTKVDSINTLVSVSPHTGGYPYTIQYGTGSVAPWGVKQLILERTPNPSLSMMPSIRIRLDALKLTDLTIIMRRLMSSK